jgi:hypothetical protein
LGKDFFGGEEGRKGKLICLRRCKDVRYTRLHPAELRAKERRRRERRRIKGWAAIDP